MVTDLYAHTSNEDRRQLAKKVEQKFFRHESAKPKEKTAVDEAQKAYQLLLEKPEIAKLIIAMMEQNST